MPNAMSPNAFKKWASFNSVMRPKLLVLAKTSTKHNVLRATLQAQPVLEPLDMVPQEALNPAGPEVCDVEDVILLAQTEVPYSPHHNTQAQQLQATELPREGFVGPLETAATLTVLHRYPVMKPSLECWKFLRVEHGHPSFLRYINTLPHQSAG